MGAVSTGVPMAGNEAYDRPQVELRSGLLRGEMVDPLGGRADQRVDVVPAARACVLRQLLVHRDCIAPHAAPAVHVIAHAPGATMEGASERASERTSARGGGSIE